MKKSAAKPQMVGPSLQAHVARLGTLHQAEVDAAATELRASERLLANMQRRRRCSATRHP